MTVPYQATGTMGESIPILIKCFQTTVAPPSSVRAVLGAGGCDRDLRRSFAWICVRFVAGCIERSRSNIEATVDFTWIRCSDFGGECFAAFDCCRYCCLTARSAMLRQAKLLAVVQIVGMDNVDDSVKLAAALNFKNSVKANWQVRTSPTQKLHLRACLCMDVSA